MSDSESFLYEKLRCASLSLQMFLVRNMQPSKTFRFKVADFSTFGKIGILAIVFEPLQLEISVGPGLCGIYVATNCLFVSPYLSQPNFLH